MGILPGLSTWEKYRTTAQLVFAVNFRVEKANRVRAPSG